MAEALSGPVGEMAEFIQRALEDLPPKIADDVMGRGIVLTGGGALLDRLDAGAGPAHRREVSWCRRRPMHCVIKGTRGGARVADRAPAPADRAVTRRRRRAGRPQRRCDMIAPSGSGAGPMALLAAGANGRPGLCRCGAGV